MDDKFENEQGAGEDSPEYNEGGAEDGNEEVKDVEADGSDLDAPQAPERTSTVERPGTKKTPQKPETPASPISSKPLTAEIISGGISLLGRTGNGLSFAYTRLDVKGKGVTSVEILEGYQHLRYVDLSENSIVDAKPLGALTYLLSIDLHKNNLRTIPMQLSECRYIQQANFSQNQIAQREFPKMPMVAWLNLSENSIRELNLENYYELQHLEVRGNKLVSTAGLLQSTKLQRLYMSGNHIVRVKGLEQLGMLTTLHLRGNAIENLEGFGAGLKALAYLNLRGNKIGAIEEVDKLAVLPGLRVLVLMENPIDQAPNYRVEVLVRLANPKLKLDRLDKSVVSEEEREEADQASQNKREPAITDAVGE
ncbi:hypothetical protein BJ742DRAFT_816567 [Cladochytrium replicatum]|nr:hypothetical protein BJ742DRAFT_816567 [Cladochytrium replicatum]